VKEFMSWSLNQWTWIRLSEDKGIWKNVLKRMPWSEKTGLRDLEKEASNKRNREGLRKI
jgi:hypothetical protein